MKDRCCIGGVFGAGFEDEFGDDLLPGVAVGNELVFEEVDKSTLIFTFGEKLAVIVEGDLGWRVNPWFEAIPSGDVFVDIVKMVGAAAKEIGGAEMMGRVVVEAKMIVENGVIGMVEFDEVFEAASSSVG